MQGMVERRMRTAIKMVADFWYTAWINAGQPNLDETMILPLSEAEQKEMEEEDNAWRTKGKPMHGHFHPETGTE
jgi:hypothetical protein